MTQQTEKTSYKSTLNLPKTTFAMRANLVQKEPASLKMWQKQRLYRRIREARAGRPRYVFHDGPPYANGSIHLGHLLNKVLKDFVVRSKTMAGFDCPYVPGWDCHGLPIEHKVMQELGDESHHMTALQIRQRCRDYANKFVRIQAQQMQRLLTLADYDSPYLTMDPAYEAATLEVFAELARRELVYRDVKPVHWSVANQTALAEAELEYRDSEDVSIYVLFEIEADSNLPSSLNAPAGATVHLMIWTTTPWTLPANLAVAVHDRYEYGLYPIKRAGKTCYAIAACALGPKLMSAGGVEPADPLGTATGSQLKGITYRHPFIDRTCPVVSADYVTLEDGTGLVHTAPGHGAEDYATGMRDGLDIYCPVQDDGTFDDTVPEWLRGIDVWSANELLVERLRESGHLFYAHPFTHSYPHDWRSKTPVIFRATEQWFIGVDTPVSRSGRRRAVGGEEAKGGTDSAARACGHTLREMALAATSSQIQFIPEWGRNRMRGMLESRPDWCLSRQRVWGLPIPAFFAENEKDYLLTAASVKAVADKVSQHGSDYWFTADPAQLLEDYDPVSDPDAPDWVKALSATDRWCHVHKSADIFDVWFESGSSWSAALRRIQGDLPADLYLEGSDQHRGWFQLSLLPALGVTGGSPFRSVLTHGFAVDREGHALAKSKGHTIEGLFEAYGADVLRWWVSSLNTENDVKVDDAFFKVAGEEYRKVRNTIRFLLSNLADYDNQNQHYLFTAEDATSLDAWALGELATLIREVCQCYDKLYFRGACVAIYNFCNDTMSAIYLAALKDRLYCDKAEPGGMGRRRRSQTAMHDIADALVRLLATILPHTTEEAWRALHGDDAESVHLQLLPEAPDLETDGNWPEVIRQRDVWLKAIEDARQQLGLDNPLDCGLVVSTSDTLSPFDPVDLADMCGISRFELDDNAPASRVLDLRSEPRCERSWKRDGTVKRRRDGAMLSDRDADAIGV